jgi:hypothetical protein
MRLVAEANSSHLALGTASPVVDTALSGYKNPNSNTQDYLVGDEVHIPSNTL